ncbi:MAG: DUF3828 domain-containing protein [Novosphingobium sp.]|nr:DUF3828 domain-containing protein [Novosphingobium sp.]
MPAIAALFLAAASLSAADGAALDEATRAIFAPYHDESSNEAPWERAIWSSEIQHLITHWESVQPEDEPDAMNDGDWLCQCQDWDSKAFRMTITSRKALEKDVAEVAVDIVLFRQADPRDAFLTFRREEGRWMLDDMYTEEYSDGIKAALRQTIVEDEKLRAEQK